MDLCSVAQDDGVQLEVLTMDLQPFGVALNGFPEVELLPVFKPCLQSFVALILCSQSSCSRLQYT